MNDIEKTELFNKYEEAIKLCKLYYELFPEDNEHLLTAISALEKQLPKKAEYHHKANGNCALTICPNCENRVTVTRYAFPLNRYCKECSQHYVVNILDWEVEE